MKKALIIAGNFWDSPFRVGTRHIAKVLLNLGWEVGFVSNPISPFHVLAGVTDELRQRFALYRSGGRRLYDDKLWIYLSGALMTPYNKPILSSKYVFENWQKFTWPNLVAKTRQAGFGEVGLIYIDTAVQGFFLNEVSYKRSILRIADLNAGHSYLSPVYSRKEVETAEKADYVLYTARSLKNYISGLQLRNNPVYFPNGVNYGHFQGTDDGTPQEFQRLRGKTVIYVGAVSFWFDAELIKYLARSRPQINFIIIGEMKKSLFAFDGAPNIHCLGAKSYDDIPSYIRNADVGLIPFNRECHPEFVDCINPLKLYEYMACGLPVVAREWKELKNINSPAYLYRNKEECLACLDKAIAEGGARKDVYKAYAKAQSWDIRVKDMLKSIGMSEG